MKKFICGIIWRISEYTNIGLGKYAPIIFGIMIGKKGEKKT
jgi:hypothetical protein